LSIGNPSHLFYTFTLYIWIKTKAGIRSVIERSWKIVNGLQNCALFDPIECCAARM
jgi:hypothetical protein